MAEGVVIDGRAVAQGVRERVRAEVAEIEAEHGVTPGLATVLVGEDPASATYVRMKRKASAEVGIASHDHEPPASVSREELAALVAELNEDESVHGILVQLPLPAHLDDAELTALIDPAKDVDGLHPVNAGLLAHGRFDEALVPCTPRGVIELLRFSGAELRGARAVVLGRSMLVGKPLAQLLLAEDATVTQAHSKTRDLAGVLAEADVLVAAAGVPRLVGAEMVKDGATVIDVGTNRTDDGLVGDVDFDAVRPKVRAITPVPGGVGPMTIAMLLQNTVEAARRQLAARRAAATTS
jgi:methylenetetrahydrofolate dehydrogenase (NADP+)/methenyltetrahydrofolate cyclohydrolase